MTIYDLTEAIARYKRFLLVGFSVLALAVLVLTFEFADGGIQWRGGLKYESAFQISVVLPGTKSLNEPQVGDSLNGAALAYSDLLSSGEAAEAIGKTAGYQLSETVDADVSRDSPIISATVIGPTPDLVRAAAESSFAWLTQKITQPLDSQPPVATVPVTPSVTLNQPFSSSITVLLDQGLKGVDADLLLIVDAPQSQSFVVPIGDRAGTEVVGGAVLEPNGSLGLSLETTGGIEYDALRVVPDPLPRSAVAFPTLDIRIGRNGVDSVRNENGEILWELDSRDIEVEWIPGIAEVPGDPVITQQFQIAMLTDQPSTVQIGGRRGPLLGISALIVGSIGMLAAVVVADTWRRDRDQHEVSSDVTIAPSATESEGMSVDVEILDVSDTASGSEPQLHPADDDPIS